MVQATLPHKRVAGTYFERKNGPYTLTLLAPPSKGLTYGSIPCLLLAWVSTEAVRIRSRELELGDSMASFRKKPSNFRVKARITWQSHPRINSPAYGPMFSV